MNQRVGPRLGVNIDHVATLRQARGTRYPAVDEAAQAAIRGGADAITVHLREDRRHIQDNDARELRRSIPVPLNFEMAATAEMLDFAIALDPAVCCIVPERRAELTTEGGLDVRRNEAALRSACASLGSAGIEVSLFIDPEREQIAAAANCGAPTIELHTGRFAECSDITSARTELAGLREATVFAVELGLRVNAGHGLHYENTAAVAGIDGIRELNIGHSIVARSVFVGLEQAVREMTLCMQVSPS